MSETITKDNSNWFWYLTRSSSREGKIRLLPSHFKHFTILLTDLCFSPSLSHQPSYIFSPSLSATNQSADRLKGVCVCVCVCVRVCVRWELMWAGWTLKDLCEMVLHFPEICTIVYKFGGEISTVCAVSKWISSSFKKVTQHPGWIRLQPTTIFTSNNKLLCL